MLARRSIPMAGLLAMAGLGGLQSEGNGREPPPFYAFCVEAGVPGTAPRPLAEGVELLRSIGFDGGGYTLPLDGSLEELLRTVEVAGLQVHLLESRIDLSPAAAAPFDPRLPEEIRKLGGRQVTVAFTLWGLRPGDPAGLEPAVAALRKLGSAAAEGEARISVYNHVDCWAESLPFIIDLVRKVDHPRVGFNFNLCHWLRVDGAGDFRALLGKNRDKLFAVTICGARVGAETWTDGLIQPLDRGDFDNRKLLATLAEIGYGGPVGLMCYGIPGDAMEHLGRSMATWRSWTSRPSHAIAIDGPVPVPEDGLILGNGDLSASIYQAADTILWRLGKGDVWDRRIDRSDDPRPARIDEVARGIRDEGWKCPPYGGPVEATRGTKDPARMREICQAVPPSYRERPYPCPKPVGELALRIPPDLPGLRIRQRLSIEEARAEVECSWPSGVVVRIESFIPPRTNVLVLRWKVDGWTDAARTGNGVPPVRLSLYRWPDPPIAAYAARFWGEWRHDAFRACASPKATPLSPPAVRADGGRPLIAQPFPPDPTFPGGFECLAAPVAPGAHVEAADPGPTGEARLHILPPPGALEGIVAIAVATTGDGGDAARSLREILDAAKDLPGATRTWEEETLAAAREFWSRSKVSVADPFIEGLWYETFHIRRAVNRPGKYPPGLFLPSTVGDYSHWHGDYHTNYNLQEPFWGDLGANHIDLADAYLDAIDPLVEVGRKIAREYYGCRGTFIQLSGYPMRMDEDPLGCVPMGRMAYMTGWAANQLWWRYLHTLDLDWLREKGWPIIRDCALFYADFMQKGPDGLWHVFPSNQGEDGFSGDPKDFTDRPQVMAHLRYCLRAAIGASEALGADEDLRGALRERLEGCAGDDGSPPERLEGIEGECARRCPPELGPGRPYRPRPVGGEGPGWPPEGDGAWTWYFGQYPWMAIRRMRAGDWIADRDFPAFRRMVERWRRPGGILGGMAVANYGRAGAWTESLGVAAALGEMMLQGWDGALRIFPSWPKAVDASFEDLRAEGAFLVSAAWKAGEVVRLQVRSEKGGRCRLYPPWPGGIRAEGGDGEEVPVSLDDWGRAGFDARPGGVYRIERSSR